MPRINYDNWFKPARAEQGHELRALPSLYRENTAFRGIQSLKLYCHIFFNERGVSWVFQGSFNLGRGFSTYNLRYNELSGLWHCQRITITHDLMDGSRTEQESGRELAILLAQSLPENLMEIGFSHTREWLVDAFRNAPHRPS